MAVVANTNSSKKAERPVAGAPLQCGNFFDVSQILAWLAKERHDIQEQLSWRANKFLTLMASFEESQIAAQGAEG